jgi:hypothetical protein
MKGLSFIQLLAGGLGALLVWAAITGKTPAQVIKDALSQTSAGPGATSANTPYVRPTGTASGDARSGIASEGGPGKRAI